MVINRNVDISAINFIECTRGNLTFQFPTFLFQLLVHIDTSTSVGSVLESGVLISPVTESFKILVAQTLRDFHEMGHIQFSIPTQHF